MTSTADSGAGSLRAAIAAASNGDTIQFDAALNGQTITLTSGELVIDKNITIAGPGPSLLAVSRDSNSMATFRIFHVTPGHTSTIEGLTISGNHANPPGGGVFNEATLTINNCRLDHNFSEGNGGGILNGGTLTIRNSSVSGSAAGALPRLDNWEWRRHLQQRDAGDQQQRDLRQRGQFLGWRHLQLRDSDDH